MKQATEPMGFVIERPCPYWVEKVKPFDGPVECFVVREDPGMLLRVCDGKYYRVVSVHRGPKDHRLKHVGSRELFICEHNGRLVE